MGEERTLNKSQHTKLPLERKILPPLLPGFKLVAFPSRVRRPYQPALLEIIALNKQGTKQQRYESPMVTPPGMPVNTRHMPFGRVYVQLVFTHVAGGVTIDDSCLHVFLVLSLVS